MERWTKLLSALNATASAFQQALYSESVIFRTFQEQVANLNLCGGLGLLDESGKQLTIRAVVCPGTTLSRLEKETGLQIQELEFAVEAVDACRKVIEGKEPLFLPDSKAVVVPLLPPAARPFAEEIFKASDGPPAICAPLVANGDVLGILTVFGPTLSPMDVPAATAFAGLIAVALQNARLFTFLRQEEARRQASEIRFRALFEQSPNPIFLLQIAPVPIILEANPAACALHGYTQAELVGRPISMLDAPADAAMIQERMETLQKEGSVHFTATHVRKDGSTLPVEITATRIEIEGEPFILSIEQDITERLRAEKELEAAHSLLQRTINGIEEPVMLIDLNYRVRLANRVVRERYAQTGVPTMLQCCYQISHGRDTPCDGLHPCPLEEVRHTGRPVVVEHIHYTRQGEKRFVEIIASPLFNERGEVTGIIEAARDITERRQAEETILRLATAVEQATDSIIITDTDGVIVYVNAAFERTTGYTRQEAIGQESPILTANRHSPDFFREIWETISGGRVWRGRFTNRKKDGSRFTEDVTITPVRNEAGVITHYVSVHRDITHELQLEEQYLQAQKMEAIGRLTGGIAHDFNNLLTAINGFAGLLKMELPADSPHQQVVSKILESGQRAATLIRQLMTFSRKQKVQPQILNLNTIVDNLRSMLRRIIGEDILLVTHLSADLWPIKADPAQMEQVILNIVVNARDAMPHGGRLTIQTTNITLDKTYTDLHVTAKPGPYVALTIADTGCGMTDEVKAHLFEPFFTTKEEGKGTGLGLSTVFGIVKQAGGHIQVYSEPEKGSAFKIYLPRAGEGTEKPASERETMEMPGGDETILVAEDEEPVRDAICHTLSTLGYTVFCAANGEEALQLASAERPALHLLLTDVVMPGLDGKDLALRLKETYPDLRILFISGYSDETIVAHDLLDAKTAFLQKPFTAPALARKVRAMLDTLPA